jgi:hypothetical protein
MISALLLQTATTRIDPSMPSKFFYKALFLSDSAVIGENHLTHIHMCVRACTHKQAIYEAGCTCHQLVNM